MSFKYLKTQIFWKFLESELSHSESIRLILSYAEPVVHGTRDLRLSFVKLDNINFSIH